MQNPLPSPKKDIIIKCKVGEVVKRFFKDYAILWYDQNLNTPEYQQYLPQLQKFCKVQTFTWWDKVSMYLQETKKTCYVIATGDEVGERLVTQISPKENVSEILVFSKDNHNSEWAKNYSKISVVETQIEDILEKIEQKLLNWFRQESSLKQNLPKFTPIASCSHNKLHRYLKVIPKSFENREQALNDFTVLSREIFSDKKNHKIISNFEQNYNEYNSENILRAYTQESFLYKVTNASLRINPNSDAIQYCRLPLKDLERAVTEQYRTQSKDFSGLLYKSVDFSAEQWSSLKENVGQEIEMLGFLSVSKEKNFTEVANPTQAVFITVLVPKGPNEEEQGFAEVESREVLFNLRSRFTILETEEDSSCRHVVLLYGAQGFSKLLTDIVPQEIPIPQNISCAHCKTSGAEIKGFTTTLESSEIPFYGYRCIKCHAKRQRFYLTCTDCNQQLCENCFGDHLDCFKQNHAIILETSPFSFWSQSMSKKELNNLKPDQSGSFEQAQMFRENREYEKAIEDYKMYIDQNQTKDERLAECYTNLAKVYIEQREYKQALECHFQALDIRKALHNGDNHPDGATSYFNIGNVSLAQEEFTMALEYHSKALDIRNSLYGENHPEIASSCHQLGLIYYKQGEYKKDNPQVLNPHLINDNREEFSRALKYLFKALEIRTSISTEEDVIKSLHSLGDLYLTQENYKEALEYFTKALKTSHTLYVENHHIVANCYHKIARVYYKQKDYPQALEYSLKSLEIRKLVLGENHPDTAFSYTSVALIYDEQGEKSEKKAMENHKKSLEIRKSLFGENHPNVATSYSHIGLAFNKKGDYTEALIFYQKSLDIRKSLFGEQHREVATCYHNIGTSLSNQRKYNEALEYHLKSLEIRKSIYGENHSLVAASYSGIGNAYQNQQDYKSALVYHLKCLDIRKTLNGEQHLDVAKSYSYLGIIYLKLKEFNQALAYFLESLDIRKALHGENHDSVALAYTNIALVYEDQKEYKTALEYHEKALEIRKILHGENHREICTSYHNLGMLCEKQGDNHKALEYYTKYLAMRKIVDGEGHRRTERAQKIVDRVTKLINAPQVFGMSPFMFSGLFRKNP